MDYLLEYANVKIGLGITLEQNLYIDSFIETAERQKNVKAVVFISSYMDEFNRIRQNPIGKLLLKKRNIKVPGIRLNRSEEQNNLAWKFYESIYHHRQQPWFYFASSLLSGDIDSKGSLRSCPILDYIILEPFNNSYSINRLQSHSGHPHLVPVSPNSFL